MKRSGQVYTVIAVLLLLVIASLFFLRAKSSMHDQHVAVAERVLSVNTFITNLEQDSERAAYIAGFRSMIAMEQLVTSQGEFLSNPALVFREIFLSGNYSNQSFQIMENSSFNQYLARVESEAGKQGILFNATISNVTLWQTDPWTVRVNYTLALNITDSRGTASWELERTFTGLVPVTDLRDPLFSVGTLAKVQRVIRQTNTSLFIYDVGDANDTTGFMGHFNSSSYYAAGRGPDMLMRFAGNLSDSEFGFESIVDITELQTQGLLVDTTVSVVDYLYFNSTDAQACSIQNVPSHIKLTTSDLDIYGITGKLEYSSC